MIQATVLLFQYKLNKAYPGLSWWAAGSLAGAVGFALNALREQEAFRLWAIIAANELLAAALALFYIGMARFLERKEHRRNLLAGMLFLFLLLAYFTLIDDQIVTRVIVMSAVVAGLSLLNAAILWRASRIRADQA